MEINALANLKASFLFNIRSLLYGEVKWESSFDSILMLGFKISLWICKDTAYSSWLVSGNWQMNNAWRLYLCLSITDGNLRIFSPPHCSAPLGFLPTPHFKAVNNLCELTRARGHFHPQFVGPLCITQLCCQFPPLGTLSSLQLRRHGTQLAVVLLSGTFLFALQVPLLTSESFIPEWWIPFPLVLSSSAISFRLVPFSVQWWLPSLFSPARN